MFLTRPVRQIAYFVEDVIEAAERHMNAFGSGPFFVLNMPKMNAVYRGTDMILDQGAAFGQWGTIQVELLQENGSGPSILRELYPTKIPTFGIHHMAMFVDDLNSAVAEYEALGYSEIMRVRPEGMKLEAAFIDTKAICGHFVELYEYSPPVAGLYTMVASAADNFDGSVPIRSIGLR